MTITEVGMITGVTGLLNVCIGWLLALYLLLLAFKRKSFYLGVSSLLFFSLVAPWLGATTYFIIVALLNSPAPTENFVISLGYPWIGIAITSWIYLCTKVMFPRVTKIAVLIYAVIAVVFAILVLIDPFAASNNAGYADSIIMTGIPDTSLAGIARVLMFLMIASGAVICAPLFGYMAVLGTREKDVKLVSQGSLEAVGLLLFCIGAVYDALISFDVFMLVIARALIVLGLISMFLGYVLPQKVMTITTHFLNKSKTQVTN